MSDPDRYDDTTDNYERVEVELLAQDRNARSPSTADLNDETARQMLRDFLDAGTHPSRRPAHPCARAQQDSVQIAATIRRLP